MSQQTQSKMITAIAEHFTDELRGPTSFDAVEIRVLMAPHHRAVYRLALNEGAALVLAAPLVVPGAEEPQEVRSYTIEAPTAVGENPHLSPEYREALAEMGGKPGFPPRWQDKVG